MSKKELSHLSLMFVVGLSGCCSPFDTECMLDKQLERYAAGHETATADTGMDGGGVDLLTIQLPFATDYTTLCTQGANGSYSHGSRATKYDVDLDTPNDSTDPVFAPVGGTAYNHDESRTKNFGHHVTIDQGDGTYVIIAHLDSIVISDGEQVAAGQLIGYEGHTGLADGDHVHIGRHSGDASLVGEYGSSINALAFNAVDKTTGRTVTEMTTEMACDLSTGHTYQSLLPTPKWHPSGSLLKSPQSSTVYLLDGFTLRTFMSETAFTSRNYDWDDVVDVTDDELACYSVGDSFTSSSLVTAVYDSTAYTGAWLIVGTATDPSRYRAQILSAGATSVLTTWGIYTTSLSSLPSPSSMGVTLSNYPVSSETATFRDGSLVSTTEASDVYVMEGGAAIPIIDWDTYLLMGYGSRTVNELSRHDFDVLVSIVGDCAADSYCIANNDVTTCGGDTEDEPGTYPGEGSGGSGDDPNTDDATGIGLELWWWTEQPADWITISGQFTNENGYSYSWNNNIAWSTWSSELHFSIADAGPGDGFRYSYAFAIDGTENWGCLGPYPPGTLTGTPLATYNGTAIAVSQVDDPGSDGCGFQVEIPR